MTKVMTEGVATFSGLSLDRSGRNLKLRFSLYGYDRLTGNWNETGVHLDTDFFHVGEGMPASLNLEQVLSGNCSCDKRPMYPHVVRLRVDELSLENNIFNCFNNRTRAVIYTEEKNTDPSYQLDMCMGALDRIPQNQSIVPRGIANSIDSSPLRTHSN